MLILLLAWTSVFFFAACGSTKSSSSENDDAPRVTRDAAKAAEVRYVSFPGRKNPTGNVFALVNDSHTDRAELYSKRVKVSEATTKVTTDDVLDAVIERVRELGFFERAQAGAAPTSPPEGYSQALELTVDGRTLTWMSGAASTPDDRVKFSQCAQAFFAIYNNTMQLQAVESAPDVESGRQPKRRQSSGTKQDG